MNADELLYKDPVSLNILQNYKQSSNFGNIIIKGKMNIANTDYSLFPDQIFAQRYDGGLMIQNGSQNFVEKRQVLLGSVKRNMQEVKLDTIKRIVDSRIEQGRDAEFGSQYIPLMEKILSKTNKIRDDVLSIISELRYRLVYMAMNSPGQYQNFVQLQQHIHDVLVINMFPHNPNLQGASATYPVTLLYRTATKGFDKLESDRTKDFGQLRNIFHYYLKTKDGLNYPGIPAWQKLVTDIVHMTNAPSQYSQLFLTGDKLYYSQDQTRQAIINTTITTNGTDLASMINFINNNVELIRSLTLQIQTTNQQGNATDISALQESISLLRQSIISKFMSLAKQMSILFAALQVADQINLV